MRCALPPASAWPCYLLWSFTPVSMQSTGFLTFVFGPISPAVARPSARAAAATARQWLKTAGNMVELRRSGNPDVQQIDAAMDARKLEQAFVDAVLAARDADPPSFVLALDAAAQATAARPGLRVVVAVLNSPSFSSEGESALENLARYARPAPSGFWYSIWGTTPNIRRLPLCTRWWRNRVALGCGRLKTWNLKWRW